MTTQPEALRLANDLTRWMPNGLTENAAAELRRLHEANNSLSRVTLRISDEFQARIAALEQALGMAVQAMDSGIWYIDQLEMIVYSPDDNGTHHDRVKLQEALATARQTLGGKA